MVALFDCGAAQGSTDKRRKQVYRHLTFENMQMAFFPVTVMTDSEAASRAIAGGRQLTPCPPARRPHLSSGVTRAGGRNMAQVASGSAHRHRQVASHSASPTGRPSTSKAAARNTERKFTTEQPARVAARDYRYKVAYVRWQGGLREGGQRRPRGRQSFAHGADMVRRPSS